MMNKMKIVKKVEKERQKEKFQQNEDQKMERRRRSRGEEEQRCAIGYQKDPFIKLCLGGIEGFFPRASLQCYCSTK